jgi:hypothetical protein
MADAHGQVQFVSGRLVMTLRVVAQQVVTITLSEHHIGWW